MRPLLKAPRIAWPTLALWLSLSGVWLASILLAIGDTVPLVACAAVSTLCAFWMFTPIHEASHNLIARSQRINLFVGHAGAVVLMCPFLAFRFAHLAHHRHTNDPQKDPDYYSGHGPTWLLPLRWLSIDVHYYRWMQDQKEGGAVFMLSLGAIGLALTAAGFGMDVLFCWLLPARLAMGLIAFSFSYYPHAPHEVTSKEDRFRASNVLLYPGLKIALLYQNYHLIHHLYPGVPFYRYARIFNAKREELRERGAAVYPAHKR